ncbi:MAG: phage tail protein [Faecousia sp.]
MAKVGCLGDIIFEVSDSKIRTIENMQWSGSARFSTHQRHGTHALTEFTGIDADTISFDIRFSAFMGVNPMQHMEMLWDYMRRGTPLQLVIGDHGYGKYRWVIKSIKNKVEYYDNRGNITSVKVSVSLLEYLKNEVI